MAKANYIRWQEGPSYGILTIPRGYVHRSGTPKNFYTVVTNNSEQWSYFVTTNDPFTTLKNIFQLGRNDVTAVGGSLQNAAPEYRLPVDWAKKDIAKKKKAGSLEFDKMYALDAPDLVSKEAMPLFNGDEATYGGFSAIKKKSAHSLKALHKTVDDSILAVSDAWSWMPVRPEINFHDKSNAFGLAYNPGSGVHIISLNARMLAEYNMDSVYRTIIHEWCHHFRDEKYPRSYDAHDGKFCELLAEVDPLVAESRKACTYFTDIKDPALASLKRKKSNLADPVWTAEAGTMYLDHLKSGNFNVMWLANKGFKWKRFSMKLNDTNMLMLLGNFGPKEWSKVDTLLVSRSGYVRTYRERLDKLNLSYKDTTYKGDPAIKINLYKMSLLIKKWFNLKSYDLLLREAEKYA